MARSVDGVDTVESEGFLVVGCLAVRQRISGARRLPFSPRGDLFGPAHIHTSTRIWATDITCPGSVCALV